MCGIVGIWTSRLDREEARRQVVAMTDRARHRGPDDQGLDVVSDAPAALSGGGAGPLVVFGHRRLSIVDLSKAGHQPMHDPVTGNWITYNGEIYNFPELRMELEGKGHRFLSHCDTEVILKGYAEWGIGCWRRLRGIFAFGLWDFRNRELHLVRDHLGVKPLYYANTTLGVCFASEVRSLLASRWCEQRLNVDALRSYLKYGSVQEPCTLVEGIVSLTAGHYLTCDSTGMVTVRHFWSVAECIVRNWERQPVADDVFALLEDSVRRQMVADVPVGVFLSGGLDSTAIAALAARAQPGNVRTFCIGSDERQFDESNEAARTAELLGCQHQTLILEGRMVSDGLSDAIDCYDQPSYDGINTYFISRLVRQQGIKVALSGLGGDELFIGYDGFRKSRALERIGRYERLSPHGARRMVFDLFGNRSPPGGAFAGAISEIFSDDLASPYFASRILFSRAHMRRLMAGVSHSASGQSAWERRECRLAQQAMGMADIDRISFLELQSYMLSTLLRDSDQMSMAHGLELRVPLIDPIVVEHLMAINTKEKTSLGVNKQLLQMALANLVPREVATRKKHGFTLPFERWLLCDLEAQIGACFQSKSLRGPWEEKAFRDVWANFKVGRVAWSRVLTLFILERWLEKNGVTA